MANAPNLAEFYYLAELYYGVDTDTPDGLYRSRLIKFGLHAGHADSRPRG